MSPPFHIGRNKDFVYPRGKAGLVDYSMNFLWAVYLVFSTIYVFQSGIPQPADYIIPGLACIVFFSGRFKITKNVLSCFKATRDFFILTAIVAISWAILSLATQEVEFGNAARSYLMPILIYFFNLMAVGIFCVLITHRQDLAIKSTLYGTLLALVIQVLVLNIYGSIHAGSGRSTGTFNNPNQLAYFAILYGVIAMALSRYYVDSSSVQDRFAIKVARLCPFIVLPIVVYLSYVSVSRSGLIAAMLLVATAHLKSVKTLVAFVLFSAIASLFVGDIALEGVERNLTRRRDQDFSANAVGRYHRLIEDPEFMIFGAGEGNKHRFTYKGGHEVHSTLGTVLFSYGVLGFFLYLRIYYRVFKAGGLWYLMMCAPPIVYGLSHNGLRQPGVWLTPIVFYFVARTIASKKAASRSSTKLLRNVATA